MPPRPNRNGTYLVLGLLLFGVALALVARKYRVPGSAPRLRMFPADDDLQRRGAGWVLPPGKEVAARAVVRLRVKAGETGVAGGAVTLEGPDGEKSRAMPDGTLLLELGRPAATATPEAAIRVRRGDGPWHDLTAPLRVSTREDALDVPVFGLELP